MRSLIVTLMRSCRQNVPTVNFWRNLREQDLPIRVQQILHQIGFYGVYRCGRIQYDCHLITALVERWRSETHSFHFRVGEATITLQDVQVIWELPIDGEPVLGTDLERTSAQWEKYCMQYIGFAPEEGALKGSRLQVKAIIEHISHVHITPDTPHLTIVQYARAVALLLLGGTMCPDSSGNLVSLLYLAKLEDIVAARNYSWGSAVLAFLYRELCNASEKGKAAIGGALQLVQNCEHTFTRTVRTTVQVIRDILDEMQYDQPYDMESNVIMAYAGDFNPQLWRSICPLIFYAIVEMHHPERVLRQFGMMQNIPDTRDMSLHKITRSNRTGTDWVLQHILYITRWQRRYDTVIQRQPISNRRDTDRGYWEWYNNITRHFVSSSTDRRVESGYQPGDAPMLQIVTLPEAFLPGERLTFKKFTQWHEDNQKVLSIVLSSMSNEIQKQYESKGQGYRSEKRKNDETSSTAASTSGAPVKLLGGGKGKRKRVRQSKIPNDVCLYCREKGHWKMECPKLLSDEVEKPKQEGPLRLSDSKAVAAKTRDLVRLSGQDELTSCVLDLIQYDVCSMVKWEIVGTGDQKPIVVCHSQSLSNNIRLKNMSEYVARTVDSKKESVPCQYYDSEISYALRDGLDSSSLWPQRLIEWEGISYGNQ
ncbi:Serine/threonine-protein phosphatase 7 long form [Sesamum angolense]|uniref:Serine/threonine-protein phosphatase 7 long form n=1 Tax=Sesamum angolense TaxID=2727404 RepID=A0AAE1WJ18_9LAMI|nr:Serine/threonine-protein phosphatase 7 long form [Sesamum angolense]